MPQGEAFWNPYRMVPIRQNITRSSPVTDEKFTGRSGIIYCTLENLTLLFVGKNRKDNTRFLTRAGRAVIPGSSLKGALRSLAEIAGGGCWVTNPREGCNSVQQLCITCRMFGMLERGPRARVHKGKISIGDALIREANPAIQQVEILLTTPSTKHTPFYLTPTTGNFDGLCRKLYFHQPHRRHSVPEIPQSIRQSMHPHIQRLYALAPGQHFDFTINFSNLTEEELTLLIYVLALEDNVVVNIGDGPNRLTLRGPLRHKIGYGKPLGMGSCHITINRLVYHSEPHTRFASLQATGETDYEGEALQTVISRLTKNIVQDNSLTMQHLRKMLVWDENDPRVFHYPDHHWFQTEANQRKQLKNI
ncbi:MAG: hypothetical protein JRI50_09095 [Deltaproteobacteria bacterium]|nr:hypothetical protein [Deltaproteobacteria bacterium]MBW2135651.1 hypothetical protein [Deltaproteobacteria bacterium]